ncbi:glycosyltransferase family 2 protein [Geminocystis sp. NIES-3708]|uniref:glycosyltransferase family 2 protein n=1 Tax=Geminocystis sp. NIES-3708 TaxID=1615909 RepID=UPI0008333CB7|nr:glycosyltransferase family 2 protein [Geminocystis sp. NIES-3708]
MLIVILFLINLTSLVILFISLIFFIECFASLFPLTIKINDSNQWYKTSVSILIPAHNEEIVIEQTLHTIIPQLKSTDELIVIADNCSDRTVEIVTRMGIKVIQRQNQELKGKGYALDFGLNYLRQNPPDIVIFIDADSIVQPNTIKILTETAIAKNKPIQGLYLMENSPEATPKDKISAFAFKVKNLVRPLGLHNLKQPCLLTGTGMTFPWHVIQKIDLGSNNIVEDMALGLDLAIAGYSPYFCLNTVILSILPQKKEVATIQRRRWEHGHLQTALQYIPRLIKESIKQKRLDLLIIASDLFIPPLSLLVSIWLGLSLISVLMIILNLNYIPFIALMIAGVMIFTGILIAWVKFGQEELPLINLLRIPLYILWKIPLYFKFLWKRENQWIRTERDI